MSGKWEPLADADVIVHLSRQLDAARDRLFRARAHHQRLVRAFNAAIIRRSRDVR
jgi:hypothetical protein